MTFDRTKQGIFVRSRPEMTFDRTKQGIFVRSFDIRQAGLTGLI